MRVEECPTRFRLSFFKKPKEKKEKRKRKHLWRLALHVEDLFFGEKARGIALIACLLGSKFHPDCFVCGKCRKPITGSFVDRSGKPWHKECAEAGRVVEQCPQCHKDLAGRVIRALGKGTQRKQGPKNALLSVFGTCYETHNFKRCC
jgi:hypothetical protein